MNLIIVSWNYIKSRPLNTLLNTLLLGFGLSIIVSIILIGAQLKEKISRNAEGISLVVGAKGSPLQLILCNIYHIDFPTGNIPLSEVITLSKNSLVKEMIPLALGDSYRGIRVVGTNPKYVALYKGEIAQGAIWDQELEVVLGASAAIRLQLQVGEKWHSEHGLQEGGQEHGDHEFTVVGILQPSNSVIDDLILTSVESIWLMHDSHQEYSHEEGEKMQEALGIKFPTDHLEEKEITGVLIKYSGPMGAVQLPRLVNKKTSMQAASPAYETARLFSIVGTGIDVMNGLAYLIVFISALSIFIALYNSLKERRYDLAIMRSMGASRRLLFLHIILESLIITFFGLTFGTLFAHGVVELIANFAAGGGIVSGITGFLFLRDELIVLALSFVVGLLASVIPAISAYRTDISKILAEG